MIRTLVLIFALILTSCAGSYKSQVKYNPLEPLRVAVLPFSQVDEAGKFVAADATLAIDDVALVSSELKGTPATILQQSVLNALSETALDVVSPGLVDAQLSHRGFLNQSTMEIDPNKVFGATPSLICNDLLSCDAILYGKVTKWDRSYYGIQSVSTVGLNLRLVSARDGTELFTVDAEDSDSRGITKGPTGFSDLVIEPIRGLSNEIIVDLAKRLVTKALAPLTLDERPEFLNTPPPAIFASSHDANGPLLDRNSPLTVVMLGSGGSIATFSIGNQIENIPMVETTEGHYIGEYYPLSTDLFQSEPVTVRLVDSVGRETSQKVGKGSVTLTEGK